MKVTTVRFPEEIEHRLTMLAKVTKRPKSYFIKEAVERVLEDMEDTYLAETEYENFLRNKEKPIPIDEMEKRLGLES